MEISAPGRFRGVGAALISALALTVGPASAGAATITPNSPNDEYTLPDGTCSLREAVESAGQDGDFGGCDTGFEVVGAYGDDVIQLPLPVYAISVGPGGDDINERGDFDIGPGVLTIRGTGAAVSTISPGLADRVLDLRSATSDLTLENVAISSGNAGSAEGGNILASVSGSDLTLLGSEVRNGKAVEGGGIYVNGINSTLTIRDSELTGNDALSEGGAIWTDQAQTVIERSTISGSQVGVGGSGLMTGGGIRQIGGNASMTITDSSIVGNSVENPGAGDLDRAQGGGIWSGSELTIRRSLLSGNFVTSADPDAIERGGGLWFGAGDPGTIVNTTFHANVAGETGDTGEGGGIYRDTGDLTVSHATFAGNNAVQDPEPGTNGDHIHGGAELRASILAGTPGVTKGCAGIDATSLGFNVFFENDSECGFDGPLGDIATAATGLVGGAPMGLGGPTDTIGLTPGSAPVDRVAAGACAAAEGTDQRGYPRPSGASCDAGAYELTICNGVVQNGPLAACVAPPPSGACAGKTATIVGTDGPDVLVGTSGPDVIAAQAGKDVARGLGGNDLICGGLGKDRLIGGAGKDRLLGQGGKDKLKGGGGKDICKGGPAKDRAASCERERSI